MDLATRLLREKGTPRDHASLQAQVLVDAELKGYPSHGLQRLPRLLLRIERGLVDPMATGDFAWRSDAVLDGDGQNGLGPVIAFNALQKLRERASTTGVAVAAIRNANHLGMLAYYVEHTAHDGFIAIALSSSEALVHPHGGKKALLGTNPVAIAVPAGNGSPLVVDLATSTVSMGKVHHFAAIGKPLQVGWAKDAKGQPTTDAKLARDGSLAPFGGAKGYALGLAFELIVAAVAGSALAPDAAGTLDAERFCNKGDVFILIEVRRSSDVSKRLAAYLDTIRTCAPDDEERPVIVPGDGARLRKARARRDGIEIDPNLLATLKGAPAPNSSHAKGSIT